MSFSLGCCSLQHTCCMSSIDASAWYKFHAQGQIGVVIYEVYISGSYQAKIRPPYTDM